MMMDLAAEAEATKATTRNNAESNLADVDMERSLYSSALQQYRHMKM